jgi:hypothetical protein
MIRNLLAGLLVLAYAFALVMSTGHLSEWYKLTLGELPKWFAVGLAAALESSAFLLSLLSNSLLRGSLWASWGAVVALGLVWVGNYFSMARAGSVSGIPGYEVFLSSMFVPVSTYVVAKVLGELLYEVKPKAEAHPEVKPRVEPQRADNLLVNPANPVRGYEVRPRVEAETGNPPVHPVNGEASPITVTPKRKGQPAVNPKPKVSDLEAEVSPSKGGETGAGTANVYRAEEVVTAEAEEEGTAEEEVVYNKRGRTDEEFLRLLDTPRPTREVAEALGITRVGALKRLRALEAKGLVRNTEAGWLAVNGLANGLPQAPKEERLKL